jgi:hypothetical protein
MEVVVHVPDHVVEPVRDKFTNSRVLEVVALDAILRYLEMIANQVQARDSGPDSLY